MEKKTDSSLCRFALKFYYGSGKRGSFKRREKQLGQMDNRLGLASGSFVFFSSISACILSALLPALAQMRWMLLLLSAFSMLPILLYTLTLHSDKSIPIGLHYLYFTLIFAAILAAGYTKLLQIDMLYFILMLLFSMFIMDKPGRINMIFFLFAAAYFVYVCMGARESLGEESVNCVAAYAASCFVSRYTVRARLEEMSSKAHIERERDTDGLTRLFTRNAAARDISAYLKNGKNSGGLCALFLIDIDNFKGVNDTLGHSCGDTLLLEISQTLRALLRRGDYVCRLGGDEFIIFLTDLPDREWTCAKASSINAALRKTVAAGKKSVEVSASIGVAFADKQLCSYEALYRSADLAMYSAKEAGGDRYALYNGRRIMTQSVINDAERKVSLR